MGLIKTFIMSLLVVVCLQIRWGEVSLERHVLNWAHSAGVVRFMNDVVGGGLKFSEDGVSRIKNWYHSSTQGQNPPYQEGSQW
jgi:hypothetical protein